MGQREGGRLRPDFLLARHAAAVVQAEVHGSGLGMTLTQFIDQQLMGHELRIEQVLPFAHREVRQFSRERAGDIAPADEVDHLLAREQSLQLPVPDPHPSISAEQEADPPQPWVPDQIPHELHLDFRREPGLFARSGGPRGDEFHGGLQVLTHIA